MLIMKHIWLVVLLNKYNCETYFDNSDIDLIPKQIQNVLDNNNIRANIYG